jgi:hypothetical protein
MGFSKEDWFIPKFGYSAILLFYAILGILKTVDPPWMNDFLKSLLKLLALKYIFALIILISIAWAIHILARRYAFTSKNRLRELEEKNRELENKVAQTAQPISQYLQVNFNENVTTNFYTNSSSATASNLGEK